MEFTRIAVLVHATSSYERGLLTGIYQYYAPKRHCLFHLFAHANPKVYGPLVQWHPHGIVGQLARLEYQERLRRWLTRHKIPAVNTSANVIPPQFPSVLPDNRGIGQMAAKYFLDRGYRNFGFVGNPLHGHSELRRAGFTEAVEAAGCTCSVFGETMRRNALKVIESYQRKLAQWIRALSFPAAIFAADDARGLRVSQVCQQEGLSVPEQVALLSSDNDETFCNFAYPPLSSIQLPLERLGFEAAKLLDQLMMGKAPPAHPMILPPVRVVTRASSDTLSIGNADVAMALQFIRQNAHRPIRVEDVLTHVPVSRSWLEHKFVELLGRAPAAEIRRVHVEHIKNLLANTDLSIPEVVAHSGYSTPTSMGQVFKRVTGMTPTSYRRSTRAREHRNSSSMRKIRTQTV